MELVGQDSMAWDGIAGDVMAWHGMGWHWMQQGRMSMYMQGSGRSTVHLSWDSAVCRVEGQSVVMLALF